MEKWWCGSRRKQDHSLFPNPLPGVLLSFPASCSLNVRSGPTKAKLHLSSLPVTSALAGSGASKDQCAFCVFIQTRSLQVFQQGAKKVPNQQQHKGLLNILEHLRKLHAWRISCHKPGNSSYQKLPGAQSGFEKFALSQIQMCFACRGMTSMPVPVQMSLVWQKFTTHTIAVFPMQWPKHIITAPWLGFKSAQSPQHNVTPYMDNWALAQN